MTIPVSKEELAGRSEIVAHVYRKFTKILKERRFVLEGELRALRALIGETTSDFDEYIRVHHEFVETRAALIEVVFIIDRLRDKGLYLDEL